MSASCTWRLLVPPGRLDGRSLVRISNVLREAGLWPLTGPAGQIWAMTTDGTGTVAFDQSRSAMEWLAQSGGLISFTGSGDADELSLSVHRASDVLIRELKAFGDTPSFDEVRLTIDEGPAKACAAAWSFFESQALAVSALCSAVFACCMHDAAVESGQRLELHQALARAELPLLPASAIAVPLGSPLIDQMHTRAILSGHRAMTQDGWCELRSGPQLCGLD